MLEPKKIVFEVGAKALIQGFDLGQAVTVVRHCQHFACIAQNTSEQVDLRSIDSHLRDPCVKPDSRRHARTHLELSSNPSWQAIVNVP